MIRAASLRPIAAALIRHRQGSTMIEFALVAAPLIALILAIMQTSLVYFAQQALESAAETSARTIMTGAVQSAAMTQADFKTAACNRLPSFMSCSKVMVDVQTVSTFSGANTATPTITYDSSGKISNAWQYDLGDPDEIVVMKLMYIWPVSTGPLGFDLSNMGTGRRLLVATTVMKTEPFQQ